MISSVYRIFRESLEYAASRSCGQTKDFASESDKEVILKAERLSGLDEADSSSSAGLLSIFSILRPDKEPMYAVADAKGQFAGYGKAPGQNQKEQYQAWQKASAAILDSADFAQALLECYQDCFSSVPSPLPGVSCYHWGKTIASIACALVYNQEKGISSDTPFALYSLDFSGIQNFIFTIISKGALKALKTRSLYLSVLSEHVSDLILSECGFGRSNLIYVGGGRAHFLLSSDQAMLEAANKVVAGVNRFLKKNFGASLYLASGWALAGKDALHSSGGKEASFSELFRTTSRMISENKLRRYSYLELTELNSEPVDAAGRTCAICGRSVRIVPWKEEHLCSTCASMEDFSAVMTDDCSELYIYETAAEKGLPVPGPEGEEFILTARADAAKAPLRKYTINSTDPESSTSVRIFICRHRATPRPDGSPALFSDLAEASTGIKRLGVFRGDVDSLGQLFAKGFYRPQDPNPVRNYNMSYYSALSGALTWFFQCNLDRVIREGTGSDLLEAGANGENVTVVYAGGDDVFLVGAWNDVLDSGMRIQTAFDNYSGGAVTLSGGYSFFPEHTPVPIMADTTADLEEEAKQKEGKNAIALFGSDSVSAKGGAVPRYGWDEFRSTVLEDKILAMKDLFGKLEDKGNSFLYHVLGYFRQVDETPMAISRLAYLLARHKPSRKNGASDEMVAAYDEFMKKVYKWALDPDENRAFRTACLIYVYLNRKTVEK